jgi:hypothetical protein
MSADSLRAFAGILSRPVHFDILRVRITGELLHLDEFRKT